MTTAHGAALNRRYPTPGKQRRTLATTSGGTKHKAELTTLTIRKGDDGVLSREPSALERLMRLSVIIIVGNSFFEMRVGLAAWP